MLNALRRAVLRFIFPDLSEADAADAPRMFSTDVSRRIRPDEVRAHLNARLEAAAPKITGRRTAAMDEFNMAASKVIDFSAPNIPELLFAWFGMQTFIGHQMCAILAQHWLIDKVCSVPARDAIRQGYTVNLPEHDEADQDKLKEAIYEANKAGHLDHHMKEFVRLGRVFGIRIALFKVRSTDAKYYENPFNPDAVTPGSYEGIVQIDPYWCLPELDASSVSDPASGSFYEPTWWTIRGKRYHKSHLRIFRTSQPPDILKPSYLYGGVPVPQKIMERVYAAERTANEAPQLAMTKRLMVQQTDIAHIMANAEKFADHMQNFSELRDNYGVKMVDIDDKVEQFDTTLTGLDSLIVTQYELVCAAGNAPVSKVLSTSPKGGLGNKGDYEEASYREELETVQTLDLTPFVDRHHLLLARSEIEPKNGLVPGSLTINIEWEPLDSPDAEGYAKINFTKAQTDDLLVGAGAIDGQDVRDRLRRENDSGYTAMLSADAPDPPDVVQIDPVNPKPGKANPAGAPKPDAPAKGANASPSKK